MEPSSPKKLYNFLDEERRSNTNPPQKFSFNPNNIEDHDQSHLSSPRTSCASATSIQIWTTNPQTPSPPLLYHCLASLHRSEGKIFSITVTKDFIFTASSSTKIHVWKKQDFTEMGFIKSTSGHIRAILACNNNLLITTHGDFKIRVWRDINVISPNYRPKKTMTLPEKKPFFSYTKKNAQHRDFISCLAYNTMEQILYTGSWDQTVRVWKIPEKKCVDSFLAHEGQVNAIVIDQSDGSVFTCSSDGTVKIWRRVFKELSTHILTVTLKFQPSPVNALSLSSSSSQTNCFLYSGSSDGLINFWEKEKNSGRFNHGGFLQGHHFAVLCLVTVEDLVLSGSEDASIRIWKREDDSNCNLHTCLAVIGGHHGPVKCLAVDLEVDEINVKGLLVYSASLDQTLKVWRVKIYPGERVNKLDKKLGGNDECKMSPVLSPSWVEKKIQGSDY